MKKTKIVCTMGPATSSLSAIKGLIKSGMNVARINMSHGSYSEHSEVIKNIKAARESLGVPLGLMIDLKGPEIRIGKFKNDSVVLKRGQDFRLVRTECLGDERSVYVSSNKLAKSVKSGQRLLLSDGQIELVVKEVKANDIFCKVKVGGVLSNNKSISVPGVSIPMKYLSEVDKQDILFGLSANMDLLAISFVQCAQDVADVREFLRANGGEDVLVVSKIESGKGVKNMSQIIEASDGVMVARGDLGVEVDFYKLPFIQKEMLKQAKDKKKFAITATQMLESMINSSRPTRAEVTDVANAVLEGSGAVMLSGETAVGVNPARCVKTMSKIVSECEKHINYSASFKECLCDKCSLVESIGYSAVASSLSLSAKSILVVTRSGKTAQIVSEFRPKAKVLAGTPSVRAYHQMSVMFGVQPFKTSEETSIEKVLYSAQAVCKKAGSIKSGDLVVQTIGSGFGETDTTKIEIIK